MQRRQGDAAIAAVGFAFVPLAVLVGWLGTSASCQASSASLTVLQRHIDPPRVVVQRLHASGDYESIEIIPPKEVVGVARAHHGAAGGWLNSLEAAGFFSWPESTLVPPPGLDVESDPIRVELRTHGAVRVLSTRAPHVPPSLRAALDSLATLAQRARPVQGCVVCMLLPAVNEPKRSVDELPETVREELQAAAAGPFPVALSQRARKQLPAGPRTVFDWHATLRRLQVECLQWQP